jgi:hypothetical protein
MNSGVFHRDGLVDGRSWSLELLEVGISTVSLVIPCRFDDVGSTSNVLVVFLECKSVGIGSIASPSIEGGYFQVGY